MLNFKTDYNIWKSQGWNIEKQNVQNYEKDKMSKGL